MALTAAIDLTVKKPDFKSMKQEIRELTVAAQQAVMQFGEFSPEAIKAEQALAEARDRMEDFNDRVAAVNPDKFAQINTVVQGVARGFQAAQGALALFGNESEDLQKTMVKLQGAMALAEGLEGLGKIQQQFGAIAKNIKTNVVSAFKNLGAMTSLAFGGLLVILPIIIANFDKIKNAILGLIPGIKTIANFVGNLVQQFTDFVGITSAAERALDKFNKTTEKNNEQLDREIALLQARGDQVGVFNKQRQKLENDLAQARANYGKNTEKEWGKIILDTKNALEILKIEEDKFNKEQAKARKSARDEAAKEREKQLKEENDRINAENLKNEKSYYESLEGIQSKGITKRFDLLYQQKTESEKLMDEYRASELAKTRQAEEQLLAEQLKRDLALKQSKENLFKASVDLANAVISLAGEQSKTGKALALSVIAADTAMAISGALKVTQSPSPDNVATGGLAGAAKYIGLAAMILTNAKKARDILKSGQPTAPTPLQVSGGGFPQMSAPSVGSSLPQVSGFEQRVFVTEGDISRTQARVGNTKRVSVVR
jgi:hypothetical protein